MFQTEIVVSAITIVTAFIISVFNAFKRRQFTINRLFVAVAFLSSALFMLQFLLLIRFPFLTTTMNTRFYFSLIHWLALLFFVLIQLFPNEPLRPRLGLILITAIPSFIMSTICAWTSLVIPYAEFKGFLTFQLGELFPIYLLVTSIYMVGSMFILIYKSRFTLESRVLSKELQYISYGLIIAIGMMLVLAFALPLVFGFNAFRNLGITIPGISIIIILNYAVYDIRIIDFKKFNLNFLKWIIIFLTAFLPVYYLFKLTGTFYRGTHIPAIIPGIAIFVYLTLFYRFIRPFIESLFNLEYKRLGDTFEEFFQSISAFNLTDQSGVKWDQFYKETIERLVDTFRISNVMLYQYNDSKNSFILKYGSTDQQDISISADHPMVKGLITIDSIIDRTLIYSDTTFERFRDATLKIFDRYGLQIIIPLFIFGEYRFGIQAGDKQLAGFLLLGELPFKRLYSKTFLSALEIYRLQFQRLLASGLVLDDVRLEQIFVHDQLVVDDIKKRITPRELHQTGTVRASSLFVNNSQQGGDFIDSVNIGKNHVVYLLGESGYHGVESSISALEMYSTLHLKQNSYVEPDKLLASLNWVVNTSRFVTQHVSATVMTVNARGETVFSNAGTNPVLFYDPVKDDFISQTTKDVPMGIERKHSFKTIKTIPTPGAVAVIYSSGVEATINTEGDHYDLGRLKRMIRANHDDTPAVIVRSIYRDYQEFTEGKNQLNDFSLIIIKF